jgi:hypothetical protein
MEPGGLPFLTGAVQWDQSYLDPVGLSDLLTAWFRGCNLGGDLIRKRKLTPSSEVLHLFEAGAPSDSYTPAVVEWTLTLPPARVSKRLVLVVPPSWSILKDSGMLHPQEDVVFLKDSASIPEMLQVLRADSTGPKAVLWVSQDDGAPRRWQSLMETRDARGVNWHLWSFLHLIHSQDVLPGTRLVWWTEPGIAPTSALGR